MHYTQRRWEEQQILNKAMCLDSEVYQAVRERMIKLFGYQTFRYGMFPEACKYCRVFYGVDD